MNDAGGEQGSRSLTDPRWLDVRTEAPDDRRPRLFAVVVECPDPSGRRWQAALDLLLEAGRESAESRATR